MNYLGWSNGRQVRWPHFIEIIEAFTRLFLPAAATKQFSCATKPFFAFGAELRKRRMVIKPANKNAGPASAAEPGDSQMRTLSFILAIAFVLVGSSMAGSSDSSLPGIGTFAYNGSPVVSSAPHPVVVAAR
jgi:hypothetical protein